MAELYVCEGNGTGPEKEGGEEMEWGSYYLGNVFEEWLGEVRRPWNGIPCSCCPL